MIRTGLVLLFLGTTLIASSQSLSVAYLEGEASVSQGATSAELSMGDSVPQNATIRLGKDSFLELSSTNAKIALSRPGTYAVHDLLSAAAGLNSAGAGSALSKTLARILTGPTTNRSAVLGARGANESESEDSAWVESSAQVFLEAGRNFVASGQYEKAIEQFTQALEATDSSDAPELHFYLGYSLSLNGDFPAARKQVLGLKPATSDAWMPDFVLVKAKLLEDESAYSEATDWLVANDLSQDAQRAQLYFFLLGVGYRGVGNTERAKAALTKAKAISGDSDLGKSAAALLQQAP